ncbi:MAG: hypothetical protein U9N30_01605 [Campylobacterota bacterium]|nr:hypothetical protein [Campylobacterota bacterium]
MINTNTQRINRFQFDKRCPKYQLSPTKVNDILSTISLNKLKIPSRSLQISMKNRKKILSNDPKTA